MKKFNHFLKSAEGKLAVVVLGIIIVLFAYYFYETNKNSNTPLEQITINENDHVRGALDGTVTLVEFGDFQCPACGAYEPLVQQVTKSNSKTLKVVFKHFPLTQMHQNALLAAKASEAASLQGKFWEMHDMLYEKQSEWSGSLNSREFFVGYARLLKLDTNKFTQDLSSKDIEAKILAEMKEGNRLEVMGTPTFFLNGKKIDNPQSLEAFNKLIKSTVTP